MGPETHALAGPCARDLVEITPSGACCASAALDSFGFGWGWRIAEDEKAHERRKSSWAKGWGRWLPDKDSNLNKQSQNLLCYHYTIGQ